MKAANPAIVKMKAIIKGSGFLEWVMTETFMTRSMSAEGGSEMRLLGEASLSTLPTQEIAGEDDILDELQ